MEVVPLALELGGGVDLVGHDASDGLQGEVKIMSCHCHSVLFVLNILSLAWHSQLRVTHASTSHTLAFYTVDRRFKVFFCISEQTQVEIFGVTCPYF
jgi:hypothetical protein